MLINFQVVSAKWFNSLPKDYQQILIEECDKAGQQVSEAILKSEQVVKKDLQKRGMTIVEVDLDAFRKAGDKAYEALKIIDAKNTVHKEIGKK
jgi:TRAP-type C4-dicarboxylate transport system substrate-binding protein